MKVNQTTILNPYHLIHGDRILIGGISIYFLYQHATEAREAVLSLNPPQFSAHCPNCGRANLEHALFCVRCGTRLEQSVLV